jgi:hypothetical protein
MLVCLYSAPVVVALRPVGDPVPDADVWWHLRAVQWIDEHGAVPQTDPFSQYGHGKPWVAYSWLFEASLYGLYAWLGLAWANLHPGVIMGQGLLVGAVGWEWLNRRLRLNAPLDAAACRRLTLVGCLGLAATSVSADPVGRFLYPLSPEAHHPILRSIPEMRPLYAFVLDPPYTADLVFVVAALTAWAVSRRFHQFLLW